MQMQLLMLLLICTCMQQLGPLGLTIEWLCQNHAQERVLSIMADKGLDALYESVGLPTDPPQPASMSGQY